MHKGGTFNEWLAEEMEDEEFRCLWEKRESAYRLAQILIRIRKAKGLSQTEVARRSGLQQPAIARLEAGAVKPSLDTIQRVAKALDQELEIRLKPRPKKVAKHAQPSVYA